MESSEAATALGARVDELFARWDREDAPGCAVGVVRDGELILERYYGMADLDHGVRIGPETVFDIASTSKQFTAAAILLLAQERLLDLDDPIQAYLPEVPEYAQPVTVRQLVHHTGGIRDHLALRHLAGARDRDHFDMQDSLEAIARQRGLNFPPGSKHMYSNSGYVLLAIIVSRLTGVSLDAFCRERFFAPLGMADTRFHDDVSAIIPNLVVNYMRRGDGVLRKSLENDDIVGDGALLTTLRDLARWEGNYVREEVGGKGFTERMSAPGTPEDDPERYAFGLHEQRYRGLRIVGHAGNLHGYSGEFIRFPEHRLAVMCLANYGGFDSPGMARRVAELYLGEHMEPVEAAVVADGSAGDAVDGPQPELASFAGSYREIETGLMIDVDHGDDGLVVRLAEERIPLRNQRGSSFDAQYQDIILSAIFERGDADAIMRLRFVYGGEALFTAEPLAPPENLDVSAYAGDYVSEELAVTAHLTVEAGTLVMRRGRAGRELLRPTLADEFSMSFGGICFVRDRRGAITGFTVAMSRASGVEFVRA